MRPAEHLGRSLSVVVVEYDPDTSQSLVNMLELYGHRPAVAETDRAAVTAAASNWPDVILLDLRPPELDVLDVARQVSVEKPGRRPLLIAGADLTRQYPGPRQTGIGRLAYAAGADVYLFKSGALRATLGRWSRLLAFAEGSGRLPRRADRYQQLSMN